MGGYFTPEQLQALEGLSTLDAEQAQLQRQLELAAQLRGQKAAPRTSPLGALLEGLGNAAGTGVAARREVELNNRMGDVLRRRSWAEKPLTQMKLAGDALRLKKGEQDLKAGEQQMSVMAAEEGRRAAADARGGEALPAAQAEMLRQLARVDPSTLTRRDLEASAGLAGAVSGQRGREADRGLRRQEMEADKAAKAAAGEAAAKKATADTEEGLRKELQSNPVTKQMQDVAAGYERVKYATSNPSAAGDMALVFGFVKMLDPGSTVREGEAASAEQAQGVPSRVLNIYNKVVSGERLPPDVRQDFLRQSRGLYQAQLGRYNALADSYRGLAGSAQVDPSRVAIPLGLETGTPAAATGMPERKSVGGKVYEKRGGQWFEVGGG